MTYSPSPSRYWPSWPCMRPRPCRGRRDCTARRSSAPPWPTTAPMASARSRRGHSPTTPTATTERWSPPRGRWPARSSPTATCRCPGDNYACPNVISAGAYCPDHRQSWAGTRTKSGEVTGTAEWKRVRVVVLKRDRYQCQVRGPRCTGRATQVDHIVNVAAGGAKLDPANLQSICPSCNAIKAGREAAKASQRLETPARAPSGAAPMTTQAATSTTRVTSTNRPGGKPRSGGGRAVDKPCGFPSEHAFSQSFSVGLGGLNSG
jgi:5-methylcytosine-specific restriction enzyme A